MEKYIGIDVHARSCTVAAMGASGKRLGMDVVETRGEALVDSVKKFQGHRYVCIEEGTQSEWIHELLAPHVADVVVIVPPENRGNKSDERDAWGLADALRTGRALTRVYKAPRGFAGLRDAARGYQMLGKDVTRVKNRLTTVYRSRGLADTSADIYRPDRREPWLAKLPASSRTLAELLGAELDALVPLKQQAAQTLNIEAKAHDAVRLLQTVPGLGEIRAAQLVAVVVTPHRFRTSRQFWNYSGLGVVTRTSADWERRQGKWVRAEVTKTRGLNRNRNPMLKSIFKAAATTVITRMTTHPMNLDYQRLTAAGTKPNLAKLTIARRLAAICLAIWKKQEAYDPDRHAHRTNAPA